MKKIITILPFIIGLLYSQTKLSDKELFYFFSEQDIADYKIEKGGSYRPMYVVLDKDTLEVTQITINENPYRDTNPRLVCIGIPSTSDYTDRGIYIHFKKYKKIEAPKNEQ